MHNWQIDLAKTKYIFLDKTNGNILQKINSSNLTNITVEGIFAIKDGSLPFDFNIKLVENNDLYKLENLDSALGSVLQYITNDIKNKKYPHLTKTFIITTIQVIFKEHFDKSDIYSLGEYEFYKPDQKTGKLVDIADNEEIKYNEKIFVKVTIKKKDDNSVWSSSIWKIDLSNNV